jgi:hypothetical protein
MNVSQALRLVRNKYTEEQRGTPTGAIADGYRQACEAFPVTMAVAHHIFAEGFKQEQG